MLRMIFVVSLAVFGLICALVHPFYSLLFYTWNAYFRPEDWAHGSVTLQQMRLSYTAALLVIIMSLIKRRQVGGPWPFGLHLFVILLFLTHGLVSSLYSPFRDGALSSWMTLAKLLTMVYMIVTLVNTQERLKMYMLVLGYSLGFEAAKQGWTSLFLHPGAPNANESPFLGDNNGVGVGMMMLVPVFGLLSRQAESQWARRLHQFFLIGVFYRSISTYSRGTFLACAALGAVYWLRSPSKLKTLIAMALPVAIVLPVLPDAFWSRMGTINTYEEVGDASAMSRIHFWNVAVGMARVHPFVGVGLDRFIDAYDTYDSSGGKYGSGRAVHSIWFGVLADLGWVGLSLYVLIYLMSLWNCHVARRIASKTGQPDLRIFAATLESSLVVFVIGGTFLPHQYNEMSWHFVGLSIALARIAHRSTETEPEEEEDEVEADEAAPGRVPYPVLGA